MSRNALHPVPENRQSFAGQPARLDKAAVKRRQSSVIPRQSSRTSSSRKSMASTAITPQNRRRSAAPTSDRRLSRRQSMAANGRYSMGFGNKDPRPVNDKEYKEYAIKAIINYLVEHNFDMPVTPKLLAQPSQKLFVSIMLFLCNQLDPGFQWNDGYEEDIPRLFKMLKYPHNINKSALKSLSSSVTWPSVLAAVEFLVNLLTFDELCKTDDEGSLGMEQQEQHEKLFFQYLEQAYSRFLDGENEFRELEQQLAVHFEEQNRQVEADVSMLQQANAEADLQLTKLQNEGDRIAATQQHLADLTADHAKFSKVVVDWEKYQTDLQSQTETYRVALKEHEKALELAELEKQEVTDRLASQELSLEDVERMHREREELDEKLLSLSDQRDRSQEQLDDSMNKFRKKSQELEDKAKIYNAHAAQLKMLPATAKNALGQDLSLQLDLEAGTSKAMVGGLDLKGTVKPAIMKLKFTYQQRSKDTYSTNVDLKQEVDTREEANAELAKELEHLRYELERQEEQYNLEKNELEMGLNQQHQQCVEVQEETQRLESASQAELLKSERTLAEMRTNLEDVRKTIDQEKQAFENDLTQALTLIMNHKSIVNAQLQRLSEEMETHAGAIAAADPLSLLD